jgi:DNA-binding transcriptional LysR family regulator
MEMRHFRYFVTLAEQATFRRAADRLGMAQPPLSRQIRALEQEVGCRLLLRTSRGIELTPAGRAFLGHARSTLAEAQRAVDQARVAAPEAADHLSIGCDAVGEMALAGRALAHLARTHPGTRIELHDIAPGATSRALAGGAMQAAIVALPLDRKEADVVIEPVGSVRLCIVVAARHPLAGPRPVSWRRLAELPFVLVARDAAPALHDAVTGALQRQGLVIRPRHRATDLRVALTLVAAGFGATIVPGGWAPASTLRLVCRPLGQPPVEVPLGVVYRRDARTPAVARLVEAARAVARPAAVVTGRGRARPSRAAS